MPVSHANHGWGPGQSPPPHADYWGQLNSRVFCNRSGKVQEGGSAGRHPANTKDRLLNGASPCKGQFFFARSTTVAIWSSPPCKVRVMRSPELLDKGMSLTPISHCR